MKTLKQRYTDNVRRLRIRNERLLGARISAQYYWDKLRVGDELNADGRVFAYWPDGSAKAISLNDLGEWAFMGDKNIEYSKKVILKDYFGEAVP